MDQQPAPKLPRRLHRPLWVSLLRLALISATAVALAIVVAVALGLGPGFLFALGLLGWGSVDADIPPARARVLLADLLRESYKIDLDPAARVIAAHEYGNFRGGDKWFLARIDPAGVARMEAAFRRTTRSSPLAGLPYDFRSLAGLGWKANPPPEVHAWRVDDRGSDCAIFLDDRFYFYFDQF